MDAHVKAVFDIARKSVQLVDTDVIFVVRSLRGREMLETGTLPLIQKFKVDSDTADADSEELLEAAKRIVVACSVTPKIVFEETTRDNEINILDISDQDIRLLFSAIIKLSKSRFYGTNRTAFDNPDKYDDLIDAQEAVCAIFDTICRRYSLNPFDVMRWDDNEIATVLAIIQCGNAAIESEIEDKKVNT